MRNALAFVADVGITFKEKASHYVKSDLTQNLMQILDGFSNNQENLSTLNYAKEVIIKISL